jgi:hypothetical protein
MTWARGDGVEPCLGAMGATREIVGLCSNMELQPAVGPSPVALRGVEADSRVGGSSR